jgi:uncharacterized protein with FMN-binding domain
MLRPDKKPQSLAGKLLLSSALVAVSLAYGWWQRHDVPGPKLAMVPASPPSPPKNLVPVPRNPAAVSRAPQPQPAVSGGGDVPDVEISSKKAAEKPPKSAAAIAKTAPQTTARPVAPAAPDVPPEQAAAASPSAPPSPAPSQIASPPQDGPVPPFLVMGVPGPGAKAPLPAGTHLEDGDYVSSRHEFMWGDLRIKIFIRGGLITGVQALQFPDHRAQSFYLSGLALPALESEVIKKQTSQVDTVSSATDTSYVFQDAVADAIVKATRG